MTLLMQNKQTKLQEATYSSSDLTPRLGYDALVKFSKEKTTETKIETTIKSFAVFCKHDTSYNYHVSLDDSEDKAIGNFLAWARMRRGVKTWKAWQAAGYSLREI